MSEESNKLVSLEQVSQCITTLTTLIENPAEFVAIPLDTQIQLMKAAGTLSRPDRKERKERNSASKRQARQEIVKQERKARSNTGIRQLREASIFSAPLQLEHLKDSSEEHTLHSPRNCYVCKAEFTKLHQFYDTMCPECGDLNYQKRFQTADMTGQVAVITGSRLKIGYYATLMMLRSGATVIATTRFPADSATRFAKESDFSEWGHRLHIYGLDLRHTPSVELFCTHIANSFDRLDVLINNAAQTVRRPSGFYAHLMENELRPLNELSHGAQTVLANHTMCKNKLNSLIVHDGELERNLPVSWNGDLPGIGIRESAKLSQIPYSYDNTLSTETVFPEGKLDADLQQVDLRTSNSWRLKLGEVPTSEMMEIQLVNAIAPFVLCNKLAPLMKKDDTGMKHIINVSAMEGKFMRFHKGDRHPHTNMAKAALNMMTHTSASEFANYGIYMNAVDTGWVTDEDPAQLSKLKEDLHDFQPPLDIVDGAARVMDPLFDGINTGKHWCGKFLKDYQPIDW